MSTDRVNRKELIIQTAGDLFREQGYSATSVRQIAEAVGVTEAALYYHFKEGKRQLLRTVLTTQMPDFTEIIPRCHGAESFSELIRCLSEKIQIVGREGMSKFRWIVAEFPRLSDEERATFHEIHVEYQSLFKAEVERFIDDPQLAHNIAMMFICMQIGYGQLFWNLELENVVEFSSETLIETAILLFDLKNIT